MSSPTKLTITSITAASGSSTHPRSTCAAPTCTQVKFTVSRTAIPCDHPVITCANAAIDRIRETPSEPMASAAAGLRNGCFITAMTPDITIGTAGISHRICAISDGTTCGVNEETVSCINLSPLHHVHLVQVRRLRVAMNLDDEAKSNRGFRGGHGNRKNRKHHASERFGMRSVAPESNQIQIGCIQHQFNADQHEDRVAPRERARKADGKQQPGHQQIACQRIHLALSFSCIATMTAPISAAVSSNARISSGNT